MIVREPPPSARFWFFAIGKRLTPAYRPWVAQQLTDPLYLRNRSRASLILPLVLVVVPQTLLALAQHSRLRLIPPLVVLVVLLVAAVANRNRTLTATARQRLLAYHGVTADGTAVEPTRTRPANPLGTTGLILLCAQVLLFSSGAAVAAEQITARRQCQELPAADLAELTAAVGVPVPAAAAAFGAPDPIVPAGTRLLAARQVQVRASGTRLVAAYVRDGDGRLLGPAVWRLDDGTLLPAGNEAISAQDLLARQITPDLGHGGISETNPAAAARACAKAAL